MTNKKDVPARTSGQEVWEALGRGRTSAITARLLSGRLGLSTRDVSRTVERLRASGFPVCASCDSEAPGYFIADGPEDLEQYLRSLDRRLLAVRRTRAALADTLSQMTGQQTMGGGPVG